jgi:hypothetical protein
METPIELDFRGHPPIPGVQAKIANYVAQLEERFGRITACHVVLTPPSHHHRMAAYEVGIRLAMPQGKEVNVTRTPDADERYLDIDFALHDAFKRARRQLQDRARKLNGQVKMRRQRSAQVPPP